MVRFERREQMNDYLVTLDVVESRCITLGLIGKVFDEWIFEPHPMRHRMGSPELLAIYNKIGELNAVDAHA